MPITTFMSFNKIPEFIVDTNLDDEKLWVPYVEGAHFQACLFNLTTGAFSNVLRIQPGAKLATHYHIGQVVGYTLRGEWHYREHYWIARPGTFIFEPVGISHTLLVDEDKTEPMMAFFYVEGGLIYTDENGKMIGYDDAFTLLKLAKQHYCSTGLDLDLLEKMVI